MMAPAATRNSGVYACFICLRPFSPVLSLALPISFAFGDHLPAGFPVF
jgi:hypothetical protein